MHNKKDQDGSGGESGNETTQNKEIVIIVRDTVGFSAMGILATVCFSTGHNVWGLWMSFVAIVSILHIPFHFLAVKNPPIRVLIWGGYGWLIVLVVIWFSAWSYLLLNPSVEPKPYPHFAFVLLDSETGVRIMDLTNDFVVVKKFGTNLDWPTAQLIFPVRIDKWVKKEGLTLRFRVRNDGPETAKNPEISFMISSNVPCEPEWGWGPMEYPPPVKESWVCKPGQILAGNAAALPGLRFPEIPVRATSSGSNVLYFSLMARDTDTPAQAVEFGAIFALVAMDSTNTTPVLVEGKRVGGQTLFPMPFVHLERIGD